MKNKITKVEGNKSVTVEISHDVTEIVNYADGYNIPMGKKTFDMTEISIDVDGKRVIYSHYMPDELSKWMKTKSTNDLMAKGAVARLGDVYIGQATYKLVMDAVAECLSGIVDDEEYLSIKSEEYRKELLAKENRQKIIDYEISLKKTGICPKCHSWCYGDCEASK